MTPTTEQAEAKARELARHLESLKTNTFLLVGSGECYNTEIVKGPDLIERIMIMSAGPDWNEHASEEAAGWKEWIEEPDNWHQDYDLGPTYYKQSLGETDQIELILIEPQALLTFHKKQESEAVGGDWSVKKVRMAHGGEWHSNEWDEWHLFRDRTKKKVAVFSDAKIAQQVVSALNKESEVVRELVQQIDDLIPTVRRYANFLNTVDSFAEENLVKMKVAKAEAFITKYGGGK